MKSLICAPKRTAIGSFQASLAGFSAPQLGATALRASLATSGLAPDRIDEVYMGCVLTAGVGQAPARQAALGAGLPQKTPCTTIGKVCGSGLKSVMLADLAVRTGEAEAVLAGGMESMSNSPYLIPKLRSGLRMGHGELVDSMIKDGLWDVYNDFHMGKAAELCASEFRLTRETQDAFARESYRRALAAIEQELFKDEIVTVEVGGRKPFAFAADEEPGRSDATKFAQLRPVFDPQGTITAANASTLNDGAAAVLVCSEDLARRENLQPFARIVAQAQTAQAPEKFTTAPAASLDLALRKAGLQRNDIALWEINEAFAVVALANLKLLEIDPARVNVRGGAVALGHPIGASGARILVTLCHALAQTKQRYGAASLCIGGGEATSVIVENLRV
jgi:acetyl-CoA C-acetyltransferase